MCVWCGTAHVELILFMSLYSGAHTSKSYAGTINMMSCCYTPTDGVCHDVSCGKSPVCSWRYDRKPAATQWMQSCSRPKAVWDSREVIFAVVLCVLPQNFSPTLMKFGFAGMMSCKKCFLHHTHNTTPAMWLKMIHISGDNILLVCLISSGCSASTLWLSWWKDNLLLA